MLGESPSFIPFSIFRVPQASTIVANNEQFTDTTSHSYANRSLRKKVGVNPGSYSTTKKWSKLKEMWTR